MVMVVKERYQAAVVTTWANRAIWAAVGTAAATFVAAGTLALLLGP